MTLADILPRGGTLPRVTDNLKFKKI